MIWLQKKSKNKNSVNNTDIAYPQKNNNFAYFYNKITFNDSQTPTNKHVTYMSHIYMFFT